ncbi:MAG TPA: hypothetical protein VGB95_03795 [Chitinophagales bacterium]
MFAQDVTTAGFADSVITVDGNANEWSVPFRFSDYTSKLQYNFRNDSSTLYFVFKTDDPLAKVKVLRYGFDIYIDTTGKKKKTEHLQFPMQYVRKQNEEPQGSVTTQYEAEQLQMKMKRDIDAMFVENFVGVENGIRPLKNLPTGQAGDTGIQAAIDFDSLGSLVYEVAIPIKLIQVKPTCEKTPWSITFHLNAPQAGMNIGRGGETLNKNRDGEGNFTNQSVATNDIDSDPYGTGGNSMLGGGMGGVGANTTQSMYGNAYGMGAGTGMLGGMGGMGGGGINSGGGMGAGGMNGMGGGGMGGGSGMGMGGGANAQMPQMKQTNPAFQPSEWKFKFRLAK